VALTADGTLDAVKGFRSGPADQVFPRLAKELSGRGGALDVKLFHFAR